MIQREWREVTRSEPCPACGKPDWCAWTAEGWLKCERETQAPQGMRRVSIKDSGAVFCPTDADEHPHHQNGRARIARKAEAKPDRLYPDPQAAVSAMQRWPSLRGCELAGQWPYHDAEGALVGLVVRFNEPDGGKTIRPVSRVAEGWVTRQMPEPRPLYGLPQLLAAAPGAPIVVCEGERSADVARACGWVATTSARGCGAADETAWTPAAGRELLILADHDDEGDKYAADVARLALAAGAESVRILRLADLWAGMPKGGDIVDLLEHRSGDAERVRAEVDALAARTDPERPDSIRPTSEGLNRNEYRLVSIAELGPAEEPDWVWPGYAACGAITLFTGLWKAGKTTLLGHLLRDLYRGGGLVESPVDGPVLIVSEEPDGLWANRREDLGLPETILFLKRGTFARPNRAEWAALLADIADDVERLGIALVVFDTLPSAWPVMNENDAGETLEALAPLRDIAAAGAAVLLIHHPRKGDGSEARATRGSGAVPGFVDVIVELRRYAPDDNEDTRRVLSAWGRFESTPAESVIDLQADGYQVLGSRVTVRQGDELETIAELLPADGPGLTFEDVKEAWPTSPKPGKTRLRGLLNQGFNEGRWHRSGTGNRNDAWRYRAHPAGADSFRPGDTPRGRIETEVTHAN